MFAVWVKERDGESRFGGGGGGGGEGRGQKDQTFLYSLA